MGCFSCLKYILVIFSILYILLGLGLIAISLWLRLDYLKEEDQQFNPGTDYFDIALYVAMGIGGFLVLMGIMGCVGTLRISLCLLGTFSVMVVVAIGGLIAVAVLAYIYKDQVMDIAVRFIRDLITFYGQPQAGTKSRAMDAVQRVLQCCGESSPQDWMHFPQLTKAIPISCCRNPVECMPNPNAFSPLNNGNPFTYNPINALDQNSFVDPVKMPTLMGYQIFPEGCATKLRNDYRFAMEILVGFAGGTAGFMLLGFIFSVAFCCVM